MAINIYDTRIMLKPFEQEFKPTSFYRKTFFGGEVTFSQTKDIDIDKVTGNRRAAVMVSPVREGRVRKKEGHKTSTFRPPYFKPKEVFTPSDAKGRMPGETIYSSNGQSPEQRVAKMVGKSLKDMDAEILRAEEALCADAIWNGEVKVYEEVNGKMEFVRVIDYERPEDHIVKLTGGDVWTAESDILGDIKKWRKLIREATGKVANTLILGSDAADIFFANEEIRKLMDLRNVEVGKIDPKELPEGVTYLGRISAPGVFVEVYSHEDHYENYKGEKVDYTPANGALLIPDSIETVFAYGAIEDFSDDTGEVITAELSRYPKSWTTKDPAVRHVMLQSAPLPILVNSKALVTATVTEAAAE